MDVVMREYEIRLTDPAGCPKSKRCTKLGKLSPALLSANLILRNNNKIIKRLKKSRRWWCFFFLFFFYLRELSQ